AITISRPLGSIVIAGPTQVNISSTSPVSGAGAFTVTGGLDVDTAPVAAPSVNWGIVNAAVGNAGNTGDNAPKTDATTGSSFSANQLTTGAVAGQLTVTATG